MRLALNFFRVDPDRGGAETYIVDLCQKLVERGHQVSLYANQWRDGVLPAQLQCHKIAVSGPTRGHRIWSFAANSEQAIRLERYDCTIGFINTWHHDVIIPQGGVHPASLEYNARRYPDNWRRTLYLLGKRLNPSARLYRRIECRQYDPARGCRVVAVSEMVRGHLEHYYKVPRNRIHVIPNAIDPTRLDVWDPDLARARFRARMNVGPDDLLALFVGHNYRLKGLGPLIQALHEREQRHPNSRPIQLIACGGGNVEPYLRQSRALGLSNRVRLLGFVPDVRDAYWGCDFFALPTYYDPCSLVVLEALACGLPVITTAQNGAGELITQGLEGFVVPSPDARVPLAEALEAMTHDPSRRLMARRASELGRSQSLDQHVARLVELFAKVASEKRTSPRSHRTPTSLVGPGIGG
jgi:UDP-glucose:(heptosyl)LPS alpha-1,3-glucosyltransferase